MSLYTHQTSVISPVFAAHLPFPSSTSMSSPGSRPAAAGATASRRPVREIGLRLVLLGAFALLQQSCGDLEGDPRASGTRLASSLLRDDTPAAADGPRFSIDGGPLACLGGTGAEGCSQGDVARARTAAARAAREARSSGEPEALHLSALADLASEPGLGKPLQRAISSLQTTATLSSHPAPVLADLAGAYLVRAERARSPRDLLSAVEAAEEALEREPGNRVARFNRALALDRFGLSAEAAHDWREYLEIDSMSVMAEQARHRLRETARTANARSPREPELDVPSATLAAWT